jgi:hypothetical protein
MGMKKSIHVLQRGATVDDIYNMTAIAVVEASSNANLEKKRQKEEYIPETVSKEKSKPELTL